MLIDHSEKLYSVRESNLRNFSRVTTFPAPREASVSHILLLVYEQFMIIFMYLLGFTITFSNFTFYAIDRNMGQL